MSVESELRLIDLSRNSLPPSAVEKFVFLRNSKIPIEVTAAEKNVHRTVIENGLIGYKLHVHWPNDGAAAGTEIGHSLAKGASRIPFGLDCKERLMVLIVSGWPGNQEIA